MAGATLFQGQAQTSCQAHHFGQVRLRFPSRALQHATCLLAAPAEIACCSCGSKTVRKVKSVFRGRRATCAGSGPDFLAGATLFRGQVQTSWQAQHVCQVRLGFPGRALRHATCLLADPAEIACCSCGRETSSGSKTVTSWILSVQESGSACCLGALFHSPPSARSLCCV